MTYYIDQALESAGEELVDYVLCHRMFRVTKRNLKRYPQLKGELLCRTQYKFLNLLKTSYPSDQVSDYNESWSCKNWRPSSLFSLYIRINIRIASHFTQGTWRESQTKLFSCLFRIFANIFTSENTGVHSTFSSLSKLVQNQWWAPVKIN